MSILYLKCLVFQPNDNFLFHSEKLKFHLLQNKEAADLKRPWNCWQFKLTNEFWASEWMITPAAIPQQLIQNLGEKSLN